MSPTTPKLPPEERDQLAAEYALGVLETGDIQFAERLIETDQAFADLVREWQARLAPLANQVGRVDPDPAVWPRILAKLDGPDGRIDAGGGAEVIRLRLSVRRWRAAAFVTTALAAAAAVLLFVTPPAPVPPAPQATRFVAHLTPPGAEGQGWIAAVDVNTRQIILVPAAQPEAPAGRVQELWYIRDSETAPRSLGVIEAAARIAAPEEVFALGGTLAVSLEPAGGSPTGQPTGPVILVGELKSVAPGGQ